jgi:DNA (cytosine-5)-methyltransferase 1
MSDPNNQHDSELKLVSIYTGAGGLDLGFEAAGFRTVAAIEMDTDARRTITANRPDWNLLDEGDALKVAAADILAKAGTAPRGIDALIGGPPCQPFSKSAFWAAGTTKRLNDPRAKTLGAMLDLAEELLPKVLVVENVRGIAYRQKDEAMKLIERRLEEINARHDTSYRTTITYLQATAFGVPQVRERAFLVAFREGQTFEAPLPVRGDGAALPLATAWDAIGGTEHKAGELATLAPQGKWADLLPSIPEGGNYLHHTDRGDGLPLFGWRTRYWSFLLKLAKDRPSWTIQADPGPATGPFHWEGRLLSIGEMARLQSFPKEYRIHGDYRSARRQIGNAVPPALAEAVARRVASVLTGSPYTSDVSLAVPLLAGMPAAQTPPGPPERYVAMAGSHAPHPGKGKGPGALRRAASAPDDGAEDADAEAVLLGDEERAAA